MNKETIEVLARSSGLTLALTAFPEDVTAAARQAADVAQKIRRPADPVAEPVQPFRHRPRQRSLLAAHRLDSRLHPALQFDLCAGKLRKTRIGFRPASPTAQQKQ